jgi:hypothetical protein
LAGYEATRDGLHKMQEQVKAAKSIVVGGAGELENFLRFGQESKVLKALNPGCQKDQKDLI